MSGERSDLRKNNDKAANLLAEGFLEIYEPSLKEVKNDLKELLTKQNKIYVDISAEKFIFVDSDINSIGNMIEQIKFYREKLLKIRKQMNQIHQRTTTLKKKAQKIEKQCLEDASML